MSVAITQNRSGSLIVFFCILLLSISCPPSLAQETLEFECVYSNSSSSLCATLCPQGCFYSLLPKPCSPEGQVSLNVRGRFGWFMDVLKCCIVNRLPYDHCDC